MCIHVLSYSEHPVDVEGTPIYFRGFKILQSILGALMIAGMNKSEEVILTGCSGIQCSSWVYHNRYYTIAMPFFFI